MNAISVCLLSGGIDSTVAATALAQSGVRRITLLTLMYGQGAEAAERVQAARVADWLMDRFPHVTDHVVLDITGGARRQQGPVARSSLSQGFVGWRSPLSGWELAGYPSTRDEAFTLIAAAGAEARLRDFDDADAAEVILATNKDDVANFPDLSGENFTRHLQAILDKKLMPLRGKPVRIRLPLIDLSKAEVVQLGARIGAPLELTWSCYFGEPGRPCRACDQCRWRQKAFAAAGIRDRACEPVAPPAEKSTVDFAVSPL